MVYIRKLEMKGFKSFEKSFTIRFTNGFNAVVGPNGSGKCVTPDTIVYLADGKRITIEELVETQFQKQIMQPFKDGGMVLGEGTHVLSIDLQKSEVVSKPILAFVRRKTPEKLVQISLKSGRSITTTLYHPVFTKALDNTIKPVRADRLFIGMTIASISETREPDQDSPYLVHTHGSNNTITISQLTQSLSPTILWDAITAIKLVPPLDPWVYDLCVADDHNFIANGICVHNSNIIDAVDFVLGQLSAHTLRSESLKDLLYAPEKKGEGTPAEFAKVTMFFDNKDRLLPSPTDVVSVSRRLSTEGTSVYRINGKRHTRTDIEDFLALAQITHAGYNIVPQGKIASIISMNPDQRRHMLEEISGIAAYDQKKTKALKELGIARRNLNDIDLLVGESKKRLDQLAEEREKAINYRKYENERTQIQAYQIDNLIHTADSRRKTSKDNITKLSKTQTTNISRLEKNLENLQSLKTSLDTFEIETTEYQEQILDNEKLISEQNIGLATLKTELENAQLFLKDYSERIANIGNQIENWNTEYSTTQEEITILEQQTSGFSTQLLELDKQYQTSKQEIEKFESENLTKKTELQNLVQEIETLKEEKSQLTGNKLASETKLSTIQENIETIEVRINELSTTLYDLEQENETIKDKLTKIETELQDHYQLRETLAIKLTKSKKEFESSSRKYQELQDRSIELESRIKAYIEVSDESSEKGTSLQSIFSSDESESVVTGLKGTLNDQYTVESRYSLAIQAALSPFNNAIVLSDKETLDICLDIISKKKINQLSFIVEENIPISEPSLKLKTKKIIDSAYNLITPKNDLESVFRFLLKDIFVTRNLLDAIELAKEYERLVTLNGDLIIRNIIFRSGDPVNIALLIEKDQDELDSLQEKLQKLQKKIETQEALIEKTEKAKENHTSQINDIQRKLDNQQFTYEANLERVEEIRTERDAIEKTLEDQKNKVNEILGELEENGKNLDQTEKKLISKQQERTSLEAVYNTEHLAQLKDQLQELDQSRSELTTQIKTNQVRLTNAQDTCSRIESERTKSKDDLKKWNKSIKDTKKKISTYQTSIEKYSAQAGKLIDHGNKLRLDINELEGKKRDLKRDIGRVERDNTGIRKIIENSKYEIIRNETEIKNLQERLIEHHETRRSYKDVRIGHEIRTLSIDQLAERLELIAIQIEQISPVNLRAIDSYKEEHSKYDELRKKKDQIDLEKQAIEDFIAEVDKEKTAIFLDAYNQINSNFQSIFSILSPGGRAELLLENPQEPFLGGIDIQSQPAGKSLLSTRMMSGGEKALTALSFILAVQQYRPAPFYIFDEIDASLDDVNSDRIATLIKTLSQNSQFILVSLRDVTVSKADKLIGVTRRHGKSTILSVNFKPTEEGVLELVEREAKEQG